MTACADCPSTIPLKRTQRAGNPASVDLESLRLLELFAAYFYVVVVLDF